MDAIVLVGGFGTRLLPLTKTIPKPLIPLANIPFVARTVEWLRDAGADHVILSLHYNAEQFIEFFSHYDLGVEISFAIEDTPLGTGGAIKNCEPFLHASRCVIANGDIFTDLSLPAMLAAHQHASAEISIALTPVDDPSRFGVVETDANGRILSFTEKPPRELARSRDINAGVYLFERSIFAYFPAGPCSVERDIFPRLLQQDVPMLGFKTPLYWTDLGTPQDYLQAHRDILARMVSIPFDAKEIAPGVWVGKRAQISDDSCIQPPVLLGDDVQIGEGATVGPHVVLGDHARVEPYALVDESILWENAVIEAGGFVRGCILGREAHAAGVALDGVCGDCGYLTHEEIVKLLRKAG